MAGLLRCYGRATAHEKTPLTLFPASLLVSCRTLCCLVVEKSAAFEVHRHRSACKPLNPVTSYKGEVGGTRH
jgi:hypothetical protein